MMFTYIIVDLNARSSKPEKFTDHKKTKLNIPFDEYKLNVVALRKRRRFRMCMKPL